MAQVKVSDLIGDIEKLKFNPGGIQKAMFEALRNITDQTVEIVDATNPFVFCMEATSVNTAAFMQQMEALTRRQYPSLAVTDEDLYFHMSDKDYIGRFAVPTTAVFSLLILRSELENSLILDVANNISKITIPRNSIFTVAGISYSLQYPIDIRKLPHGNIQIVYNADVTSPLHTLETNVIDWEEVSAPTGEKFVKFDVLAHQFKVATKYADVNSASGFKTTVALTDQFYYARVYRQNSLNQWVEMKTTHTEQVYDSRVPTATLKLLDQKIEVTVPVIYTTTNQVSGKIRIDIYETKGPLTLFFGNYAPSDFSAKWLNIDENEVNAYTSEINNIKTLLVYSKTQVTGGRLKLSTEELRDRIIQNNTGPQALPITNVQLQTSIIDKGYDVVKEVDSITNRIFLATKPMPKPADERLITAAAAGVSTVVLSYASIANAYGVIHNGASKTLTPEALYQNVKGITRLVTQTAYAQLEGLAISQKVDRINNSNYLYTPFHYVLNSTNDSFDGRPYYMDSPEVISRSFIQENPTTALQVSIEANFAIHRTSTGYKLTLQTKSTDAFKALPDNQVFVQLAFSTEKQTIPVYMLGVQRPRALVTDERIFEFAMDTQFDIDSSDTLDQPSFISGRSNLVQDISVLFCTTAPMPLSFRSTDIDLRLGRLQLPGSVVGITHESVKVRFGYSLKTLWAQAKSVIASVSYMKHTADVLAFYEKDIFDIDPLTGSAFTVNGSGGLVYSYLHRIGDPVLDSNFVQLFKHRQGEPVLDLDGNPIPDPALSNEMIRNIDIALIEGVYRFATDSAARDYRALITSSVVNWLTEDLVALNSNLLDQTKIYFYPKISQGNVKAIAPDGTAMEIAAGQSLTVNLAVPTETFNNVALTSAISKNTIKIIDTYLRTLTTSISVIESQLRNSYATDVIDVQVTGLGGDANYRTITLLEKSTKLSLKKKLVSLADGQLIVKEDININFIEHSRQ